MDYLSAPGECAKCDEARRIADVDMRRIEGLLRKQIAAELRAAGGNFDMAAKCIKRRRPVKHEEEFDQEKVVAALQSDNPGDLLRGWAAVLNQLEMYTPKGQKTNDMVVERLLQDADRFDDLEEHIAKIAALAWEEGVATALNFARRDPNGITLSLPNHANPYRNGDPK